MSDSRIDGSLFMRAVKLHGADLERFVKEEQGVNFGGAASYVRTAENDVNSAPSSSSKSTSKELKPTGKKDERSSDKIAAGGQFSNKLYGFIARKADLLFQQQHSDKDETIANPGFSNDVEKSDFYAILPPIEQFLGLSPDISQRRLFDVLRVGDVIIGQILSTKEFGLFVKLLAHCQGASRFLEECEVVAFLPAGELRDKFAHVASVDDFQIGDLIRALVIRVNVEEEKVIISLHSKDEAEDIGSLGLITESDLPVHYRRSVLQLDTQESYQEMLVNTVGFDNPFNVAYLGARLGLNEDCPVSLMRGLQRSNFPEKEFAEPLRKWQTSRWSMESVAKGVEHFKAGKLLDAMQHLNKALEIDDENVEALVARGALYANKDLLSKALQDFGKALKINPNHRNANKYLSETLVERGKQHEEAGETEKAADCYQTVLDIKPDFLEAQLCLQKVKRTRSPEKRDASPESISSPHSSPGVMSVTALRQLVEPENDVPRSAKKKVKKTKKKEREKESTRKMYREERSVGKSEKQLHKKRRHSNSESCDSSRSRSRSRLRSHHQSGKQRKPKPRRSKKHSRRSYSSVSSTSDGSVSEEPRKNLDRQRKHSKQGKSSDEDDLRPRCKHKSWQPNKRKDLDDSANLEWLNYSGGKKQISNSARRKSVSRSRSRSTYSDSESSYNSIFPKRSRKRSRSKEHDRRKRMDEPHNRSRDKTFREVAKTTRYHSPSVSPSSRHRTLSRESHESRSKTFESVEKSKRHREKSSDKLRYKESSRESMLSMKRESKERCFVEETGSKPGELKAPPTGSPPRKKNKIAQKPSEGLGGSRKLEKAERKRCLEKTDRAKFTDASDVHKQKMSQQSRDSKKKTSKVYDQESQKHSHSDAHSSGDEKHLKKHSKYSLLTTGHKDGFKIADQKLTKSEDSKINPSHESSADRRSRSRSYSSDGSYSDTSYSSYSSYSVSGSRSYSYSSYSSGSYSSSDDRRYRRKSSQKRRSRDKSGGDNQEGDSDESDSDVDTGIYEISRDHLELYMESKSYQLQKAVDKSPLKGQKKPRKNEAGKADNKRKSRKEKRDTSDDERDKSKTPVLFPAAYKESQMTSKHTKSLDKSQTKRGASPDSNPVSVHTKTSRTAPDPVVHSSREPDALKREQNEKAFTSGQGDSKVSAEEPSHPGKVVVPGVASHKLVTPSQEGFGLEPSRRQQILTDTSRPQYLLADQSASLPDDKSQDLMSNLRSLHSITPPSHSLPLAASKQTLDHPEKFFTQEQISVIESFSKQLAETRHSTSNREPLDTKPIQHDLMQQDDKEVYRRLPHALSQVQGHPIGVVMTQRPDNGLNSVTEYHGMDPRSSTDFSDRGKRKRRWDVKDHRGDKDESLGSEQKNRKGIPLEDVKPAPVSIDYMHGSASRHTSACSRSEGHPQRETFKSDRPSSRSLDWSGSLNRHENEERYRAHHSRRGERPRAETYSTRRDQEGIERSVGSSASGIKVVDYQHGRSGRHRERSRDRCDSRHHRSPWGKYESRSSGQSSYKHNSGDRHHYEDRDRHRHDHGRHSHHGRYDETSSHRTHNKTQGRETPFESKESNPFLHLVSSSKDMQVASLHSEGKWHDFSPQDPKLSSRSWWV